MFDQMLVVTFETYLKTDEMTSPCDVNSLVVLMMVVSLNRFENLLCISVLIILNVCKGARILPQSFYIRIRRGL